MPYIIKFVRWIRVWRSYVLRFVKTHHSKNGFLSTEMTRSKHLTACYSPHSVSVTDFSVDRNLDVVISLRGEYINSCHCDWEINRWFLTHSQPWSGRAAIEKTFKAQELCVKVEAAVLGSPSLTVLVVSAGVKLHLRKKKDKKKKRRYPWSFRGLA